MFSRQWDVAAIYSSASGSQKQKASQAPNNNQEEEEEMIAKSDSSDSVTTWLVVSSITWHALAWSGIPEADHALSLALILMLSLSLLLPSSSLVLLVANVELVLQTIEELGLICAALCVVVLAGGLWKAFHIS